MNLDLFQVSVQADTPAGPWAFSLHLVAPDRDQARQDALAYVSALLAAEANLRVKRVACFEVLVFIRSSRPDLGGRRLWVSHLILTEWQKARAFLTSAEVGPATWLESPRFIR